MVLTPVANIFRYREIRAQNFMSAFEQNARELWQKCSTHLF